MRRILLVTGLILAIFATAQIRSTHAQTMDAKAVAEAYKQAFASGNLDATFALFDDNVVIPGKQGCPGFSFC